MEAEQFYNELEEMICLINKQYIEYHNGCNEGRVKRGRIPTCSSFYEDKFGNILTKFYPDDYLILIDCPLSFQEQSKPRKTVKYPDICIVKREHDKQTLIAIIELSIDLGWLDTVNWYNQFNNKVISIRGGQEFSYSVLSDHNSKRTQKIQKEKFSINVRNDLPFFKVLLSGANHGERLANHRECLGDSFVCLMKDHHPNVPPITAETMQEIFDQNNKDWDKLFSFLNVQVADG